MGLLSPTLRWKRIQQGLELSTITTMHGKQICSQSYLHLPSRLSQQLLRFSNLLRQYVYGNFFVNLQRFFLFNEIHAKDAHEGSMGNVGLIDGEMEHNLEWLVKSGDMERSAVFIISDHGQYYGPYADNTEVGTQEHSLPAFFMILPTWFLDRFPAARDRLTQNQHRLFASWDVYKTLAHLSTYPEHPDMKRLSMNDPPWASSLLTEISINRTCREAGISEFWCVCNKSFYGGQIPQRP